MFITAKDMPNWSQYTIADEFDCNAMQNLPKNPVLQTCFDPRFVSDFLLRLL
jgi:hypothetical protein